MGGYKNFEGSNAIGNDHYFQIVQRIIDGGMMYV